MIYPVRYMLIIVQDIHFFKKSHKFIETSSSAITLLVDLTFSKPRKVLFYELVLVIRNLMGS